MASNPPLQNLPSHPTAYKFSINTILKETKKN
uniref:Uncharacterized protein n=1 Tax=Lepeophtheirus salmonis TaxID=72036 RepID=A0A0K2VKT8_LEPSM